MAPNQRLLRAQKTRVKIECTGGERIVKLLEDDGESWSLAVSFIERRSNSGKTHYGWKAIVRAVYEGSGEREGHIVVHVQGSLYSLWSLYSTCYFDVGVVEGENGLTRKWIYLDAHLSVPQKPAKPSPPPPKPPTPPPPLPSALADVPLSYLGRLLKDARLHDSAEDPGAEELKPPQEEPEEELKATKDSAAKEEPLTEPLEEAREDFADFQLVSGGEAVPIHRAIFAAASDVFRKIFTNDMADKARGFAQIDDVPAQTLRDLKIFIYTGAVEKVRLDPAAFLDLAERYAIGELKAFCAEEMGRQLSSSTVCSTAVLAERYGLGELVRKCGVHLRPLVNSAKAPDDWAQLKLLHPSLALSLLGV